jgi:hypothetical protein
VLVSIESARIDCDGEFIVVKETADHRKVSSAVVGAPTRQATLGHRVVTPGVTRATRSCMVHLRSFATLSIIALLHAACITDAPDDGPGTDDPSEPQTFEEAAARYADAMCIDDFRAAGMSSAWESTTMYPHEAAYCSSCHGDGRFGFLAPNYSISDPVQRERTFFDGLKTKREYLQGYVTPVVDPAGKIIMVVNRTGLASIAAGNFGHERFTLEQQPGFPALVRFHVLTMQRLGSPCTPLQ